MGVFSSAPVFKAAPAKKKGGGRWNIYAQRAKQRKDLLALADENIRLRAENDRLTITVRRLQRENDALWREIGPQTD